MKTAQLPPVRVAPSVRAQIEAVLNAGETLSQFVEQAAVQAAQRRQAQQAFVARGRAALVRAQQTGVLHDADVQVDLPGGSLRIRNNTATGTVLMAGSATFVFEGEWL